MNGRCLLLPCLALLGCLGSRLPAAESLSLIPDSAQALGTAGGRFANLQDASAVRVNPANVAEFERPELLISTGLWHGDIKFRSDSGLSLEHEMPWEYPASVYAVVPVTPGSLSFGLGLSSPYGLGATYSRDSVLRYAVPYESRLVALSITPALAWKVHEDVSIGVGLDFMHARLEINQMVPLGPGLPDGEFKFGGDGWGIGGYLGITWTPAPGHRLALVGRLPMQVEYDGSFEAQRLPDAGPGLDNRSAFYSDMTFPGSIALGYGWDLTERLTLGFDFKWTANSSHDDIPLRTSDSAGWLPTQAVELDWHNSIDLGMGASYKLAKAWTLRGGYLFSENSMPDSSYTPAIPAYDRHIFSLGLGWQGRRNGVDLTYGFIWNPGRTVRDADQPLFNGRYKHQWHVVALSFSHRF